MDIGASVLAKLKNKSKDSGMSFQVHLRLFCRNPKEPGASETSILSNLFLLLIWGCFMFLFCV